MLKRMISLFLCVAILVSILPVQVIALETEELTEQVLETEPVEEEVTEPVEEDTAPTEETVAPAEGETIPAEGETEPIMEVTEPVEEANIPTEETVAHVEEETIPAEEMPELQQIKQELMLADSTIIAGGTCGDDLTWVVDNEGVLTISGTGDMYDYDVAESPWYNYRDAKTAVVEEGVTSIGKNAFWWTSVEQILLPNSITKIGEAAFAGSALYGIDLPGSITTIPKNAFEGANGMQYVGISEGITTIEDGAFYDCTGLTSIDFPDSLLRIEENAFWSKGGTLDMFTIPKNIEYIGYRALGAPECVVFEGKAPSFDAGAFNNNVTVMYYPSDNATWTADVMQDYGGTLTWMPYGDSLPMSGVLTDAINWEFSEETGTLTLTGTGALPDNNTSDYIAPWMHLQPEIRKLVVQSGITEIGIYLFSNYGTLDTVVLGDTVECIERSAFKGCTALQEINIPNSVTSIDDDAFYGCSSLQEVIIPDSVTSLGESAFSRCTSLTNVALPSGLNTIPCALFSLCNALVEINIPESVKYIDTNAFLACESLAEIVLLDGLEGIAGSAFAYCEKLTGITFPASVTSIENYAFEECVSLKEINFLGNAPTVGSDAFLEVEATAYYPLDNTTWTEEVRQSFGDSITWVAKTKEDQTESITLNQTSISLDCLESCQLQATVVPVDAAVRWVSEDETVATVSADGLVTAVNAGNTVIRVEATDGSGVFAECNVMVNVTTYTIAYDANGGSNAPASQTKTHGQAITLTDVIPDNYSDMFMGWATYPDCYAQTPEYMPGDTYTAEGDETLYAVWSSAHLFEVKDWGIGVNFNFKDQYYTCGVTLPETTKVRLYSSGAADTMVYLYDRDGKLLGFNDNGGNGNNYAITYQFEANTTYFFKIKLKNGATGQTIYYMNRIYDVVYDANGGINAPANQTKIHGEDLILRETAPTREGYTYLGWATTPDATEVEYRACDDYTLDQDVTLYALWDPTGEKVVSLRIVMLPQKQVYEVGETLDLGGMAIEAEYTDGSWYVYQENQFREHWTVTGFDSSTPGEKTVTVSFSNKSVSFTVTVIDDEEDVTWEFKEDTHTLMIRGTGEINSLYDANAVAPWDAYKNDIQRVIVFDGVTGFSNLGLSHCDIILFTGNAPHMFDADSFKDLYSSFGRTIISYSTDTSGWENFIGQQFGGNVTWATQDSAVSRLRNLCVATSWLSAEEIRTNLRLIKRDEILEGMRSGLFIGNESYDSEISVLEEAMGSSCEIQFRNVPKLAALGATHWWHAEGVALNDPIDSDTGHVLLFSKTNNPVPVPDGYDKTCSIPFAVSISNLQNEEYLAVPVNVAMNYGHTESGVSNPFFYSVFWRNNQTGEVEEIPLRIRWHKSGYYMEFVMEGTGEYLLAAKTEAKAGACGDGLTWTYTLDSTLTISGNGDMYDYDLDNNLSPWYYFREQVQNLIIEDGVTGLGSYAFNDCRFVNQLMIPASVERIGEGALYGMYNLSIMHFDGAAPDIVENAFYKLRCSAYYDPAEEGWDEAVQSIYGAEPNKNYGFHWVPLVYSGECGEDLTWTFDQTTGTLTISGTGNMPHFDTDAENMAPWAGLSPEIRKIVLEEGVLNISFMSFYMCNNAEELVIADSVTTIAEASFPAMESINIPKGVTQMYFTEGGINCRNVHVSEENAVYASIDGVLFNKDKTTLLRYPSMRKGDYTVPDGVTAIAEWAFANNKGLTGIILPESLEAIGRIAFSYTGLMELDVPEHVKTIDSSAFSYCYGLEYVILGAQVEIIASGAFEGCRNLKGITFTGDAPEIDSVAFRDITANACYPVDNGTWTDDVMQNYGGKLTWIGVGKVDNRVVVKTAELEGQTSVWVDGKEYVVTQNGETAYVDLPDSNAKTMTVYTYHMDDAADIQTQYPVSMKVWTLENEDGFYTATRQEAFDNILQYSGVSIRVFGKKGIRMITSIEWDKKDALISGGLAGYTLKEYGTAIAWSGQLSSIKPLVLGKSYVNSNYAYKEAVSDPVFKYTSDLMQYTNVLVNFTNDQCKDNIAMRPYMILADENGEEITLYGGILHRSIGYIAYRNRNTFEPGTDEYEYVWDIIKYVYGDIYSDEYRNAWSPPIM